MCETKIIVNKERKKVEILTFSLFDFLINSPCCSLSSLLSNTFFYLSSLRLFSISPFSLPFNRLLSWFLIRKRHIRIVLWVFLCWQLQSEFMILFTFLIHIEIVCFLSFHISKYNEKSERYGFNEKKENSQRKIFLSWWKFTVKEKSSEKLCKKKCSLSLKSN